MRRKNKKQRTKDTISVVIIARNEEEKIEDCLTSVKWTDEMLVVDNDSSDKTRAVASKHGAVVINAPKGFILKYSRLRNLGLKKARGKWILYVDADERVEPALAQEINRLTDQPINRLTFYSYAIPRKNIVLGKELKHGGFYPDYVKRLFKKEKLKGWKGDLHEEPKVSGEMGHFTNHLIHVKENNLSDMVEKTNDWSEIEAKEMFRAGHPKMNIARFFTAAFREFWYRFVLRKAFLDGSIGIIYGLYQVYSRLISYMKLWELQLGEGRASRTSIKGRAS